MSKTVLIAGGACFIGSRLVNRFEKAGFAVTVFNSLIPQAHGSNPPHTSALLKTLHTSKRLIVGSVCDRYDLAATR